MASADPNLFDLLSASPEWSVAVAESVTAGHLQARVGANPKISQVFKGGITAYSIEQKVRHLGVNPVHASEVDCVSRQVAEEMARGACALFGASIGVSTTGYADQHPEPFAYWAICYNNGSCMTIVRSEREVAPPGLNRCQVQDHVAGVVFGALVEELVKLRKR